MKILHLAEYFQPKLGYQEYYLAREQQKLGHKVIVVTSDRYFPFPNFEKIYKDIYEKRIVEIGQFVEEGVKVIRLPVLFEFGHGSAIFIRNLYSTIKNIRPDVIEVDGVFSILSFQAALISQRLKIPLVFDTHASTFNTKLDDTLVKKLYYFFFRKIAIPQIKKTANAFTAVGQSEKFLLCREFQLPENKVKIIPLGADTELFKRNEKARREIRRKLEIRDGEVLIIYAGKVSEEKDIHILIEAIYLLAKKVSQFKLLLVGNGSQEYIDFLKQQVHNFGLQKYVIFHPFVLRSELVKYYSAADIGVWPGNLSNTILEALACSLSIVVPKVISQAQTSDHLVLYKNGLQFIRGESSGLTKCLEEMANFHIKRKKMGKRSRKLVRDKFSWQTIAKRHLDIYNRVIFSRKNSKLCQK